MRSMREPLFDLEQVESVTKLVKLKVSFRSGKWLDESEVGLKYLYSNLLLRLSYHIHLNLRGESHKFPQKTQFLRSLQNGRQIKCTTFS